MSDDLMITTNLDGDENSPRSTPSAPISTFPSKPVTEQSSLTSNDIDETKLVRKMSWRLIPFLSFLYLLSFLDRVNIGNAHLSFMKDINIDEHQYSAAVSIFFAGYVIFEVPSNLLMQRTSPSRWISRIMVTWGICSVLMAFVFNFDSLMACRFFLGVAEAGFFPGIVFFLTRWFKPNERSFRIALFFCSAALAGMVGGLVAYSLLQMEGVGGLHGWQWLFIAEGAPTVVVGVIVWFVLPDSPRDVSWLSEAEKEFAVKRLLDHGASDDHRISWRDVRATVTDWRVIATALVYFTILVPFYGLSFFLPSIIRSTGFDIVISNLLTVPIYGTSLLTTLFNAFHSDRKQERALHISTAGIFGMIGFALLFVAQYTEQNSVAFSLVSVTLASAAVWAMVAPTLAWLTDSLQGTTSMAVGTAFVIGAGNCGGVIGPTMFGFSPKWAALMCTCSLAVGILLVLVLRSCDLRRKQQSSVDTSQSRAAVVTLE